MTSALPRKDGDSTPERAKDGERASLGTRCMGESAPPALFGVPLRSGLPWRPLRLRPLAVRAMALRAVMAAGRLEGARATSDSSAAAASVDSTASSLALERRVGNFDES